MPTRADEYIGACAPAGIVPPSPETRTEKLYGRGSPSVAGDAVALPGDPVFTNQKVSSSPFTILRTILASGRSKHLRNVAIVSMWLCRAFYIIRSPLARIALRNEFSASKSFASALPSMARSTSRNRTKQALASAKISPALSQRSNSNFPEHYWQSHNDSPRTTIEHAADRRHRTGNISEEINLTGQHLYECTPPARRLDYRTLFYYQRPNVFISGG